ncbi:hypothetical protein BDA99DRAFT_541475 [Phascolomyces articulosus]|uniref:Uncharacterized protein n=1 Tax=Phascolomyces articulosus TaxID=60185 RepID=A0AAD5JSG3_9FUNG|nr:hypothetical protein BDA99DRAFT_541475 [Phascolomyces articulosus]
MIVKMYIYMLLLRETILAFYVVLRFSTSFNEDADDDVGILSFSGIPFVLALLIDGDNSAVYDYNKNRMREIVSPQSNLHSLCSSPNKLPVHLLLGRTTTFLTQKEQTWFTRFVTAIRVTSSGSIDLVK